MLCYHSYIYTDYSRICCICGEESPSMRLDTYNKFSAPLIKGYNRESRFKIKITKLVGLHSGPKHADLVWPLLNRVKSELHHPNDIRKHLRSFCLRHKHYDSVRTFTDIFTSFRVSHVDPYRHRKIIHTRFVDILMAWTAQNLNTFFSYDYLLRYILDEIKSPLIVYCKAATSKKRLQKYDDMLALISSHNDDKRSNRMIAIDHSLNA